MLVSSEEHSSMSANDKADITGDSNWISKVNFTILMEMDRKCQNHASKFAACYFKIHLKQ